MMRSCASIGVLLIVAACSGGTEAPRTESIAESAPAKRVVAFAPHFAELMYAIGAGDKLVGVSAWSDYPPQVRDLPQVGDAFTVDQERLRLLDPDLLLVWESGMPSHTVDELRKGGYRVEVIRTRGLADVSIAMRRIGELTGKEKDAAAAVARFEDKIDDLRTTYAKAEPITVFFQVSARPLYTVNREHFISEVIDICGGQNVFAELDELAPGIAVEAVVERDPEVIIAGSNAGDEAFSVWARWPEIDANRYANHFLISDESIGRATPRLAGAGLAVCEALDQARLNRDARR